MDLQERIEETKRRIFLSRIAERSATEPEQGVPSGDLGHELGLAYEQALGIVGELESAGCIRRADALAPPHGPMVRLTRKGERVVARTRAA